VNMVKEWINFDSTKGGTIMFQFLENLKRLKVILFLGPSKSTNIPSRSWLNGI
jgi:hypothetical protein